MMCATPGEPTTLLVLGSMDEFVDLVERAHERGCTILVADGYENGPARSCADASFVVPITDTEVLANLCDTHDVRAIITSFSDVLFEAGCCVAHAAKLPAPCTLEKLECFRDKERMKSMFDQLDIVHPKSRVVSAHLADTVCNEMRFPLVLKPLDGYGSYGVRVVRNAAEVATSAAEVAAESRRTAKVVLEEYDDGLEFNMITWISDGSVYLVSVADREKTARGEGELPHVSRIIYPSRYSKSVAPQALEYAQRVADFTGIEHGPLCMQFFWSPESGIRVCEVTGRVFGYEHELLELACGLAVEDLLLDTALDHRALTNRLNTHDALMMPRRSCGLYFHARDGVVADLTRARMTLDDPSVLQSRLYYAEGDVVHNVRGGRPYAAQAFLVAPTYQQLDERSDRLFSRFSITGVAGEELALPNRIASTTPKDELSNPATRLATDTERMR